MARKKSVTVYQNSHKHLKRQLIFPIPFPSFPENGTSIQPDETSGPASLSSADDLGFLQGGSN